MRAPQRAHIQTLKRRPRAQRCWRRSGAGNPTAFVLSNASACPDARTADAATPRSAHSYSTRRASLRPLRRGETGGQILDSTSGRSVRVPARDFGYRLDFVARHLNRSSAALARAVDPDRDHLTRVVGRCHHPGSALQRRRPDQPHPTADVHAGTAGCQRALLRSNARQRRLTRGTAAGRTGRGEAPAATLADCRVHATADSVTCSVRGPGAGLPAGHSYRGKVGTAILSEQRSPEPA